MLALTEREKAATAFLKFESPVFPDLNAVLPPAGTAGKTVVRVYGSSLEGGTDRRCRFGAVDAAASLSPAADHLLCLAPLTAVVGQVAVRVTLNGQQYTQNRSNLQFVLLPRDGDSAAAGGGGVRVSAIEPPLGPITGGTSVAVQGAGFVDIPGSISCRFAEQVVPAIFETPTRLRCLSPAANSTALLALQVSLNGLDWFGETNFF